MLQNIVFLGGFLELGKMYIEERAINLAHYIIDSKDTVRGAAKKFGVSKSTVHKDVSERLLKISPCLAAEVRSVLDENKAERHIRGGMATKLKYSHEHEGINGKVRIISCEQLGTGLFCAVIAQNKPVPNCSLFSIFPLCYIHYLHKLLDQ